MAIKFDTSIEAFDKFIGSCGDIIEEEIMEALAELSEQCVEKIRNRPGEQSWFNRTGKLRSSIGAAVYNRGQKVMETEFDIILNGEEGAAIGRAKINSLASQYSKVLAMVVVAGMDYAEDVERMENKDVLNSTQLWAQSVVQRYLERARERAISRINMMRI